MKFIIRHTINKNPRLYWIDIEGVRNHTDNEIARMLCISLENYHQELLKFNFKIYHMTFNITFTNIQDAKKMLEYLENKYGIILALTGEYKYD